jgi:hypothetical protein
VRTLIELAVVVAIAALLLSSCAPKRTLPDGAYPKHPPKERPMPKGTIVDDWMKVRCLGGRLGGC